jgi:carboxyl-terminal processing protease
MRRVTLFAVLLALDAVAAPPGPAPTCSYARWMVRAALNRHATITTLGPDVANRARRQALELLEAQTPLVTKADVAQLGEALAGEPAQLARDWAAGDCGRFEALAAARRSWLQRQARLVEEAFREGPTVAGEAEADRERGLGLVRDEVARASAWAVEDQARRFAYQRLTHLLSRALEGGDEWAYVTMAAAIVGALDPHTAFLPEAEAVEGEEHRGAGRHLFGILMRGEAVTPWGIVLDAAVPGTSAERSGVKRGQLLRAIDGVSTVGLSLDELSALFDRARGSVVLELVEVKDKALLSRRVVTLRRTAAVDLDHRVTVSAEERGGVRVATVKFRNFFQGVSGQVSAVLVKLRADVVVLDLQDNSGGLVSELLAVADLFCADDVYLLSRDGNGLMRWPSPGRDQVWSGPLIVTVNRHSASASELLAGTLQAKGRALVVGAEATFGKGTMQQPLRRELGMWWGDLVVTTAQTFLMNGVSPQCVGVTPDVLVGAVQDSAERECSRDGALAAASIGDQTSDEDAARRAQLRMVGLSLAGQPSVLDVAAEYGRERAGLRAGLGRR